MMNKLGKSVLALALAVFVAMVAYVSSYEKTVGKSLDIEITKVDDLSCRKR